MLRSVAEVVSILPRALARVVTWALVVWRYSTFNRSERRRWQRSMIRAQAIVRSSARAHRLTPGAAVAMATKTDAPAAISDGAFFGLPGLTNWTEQTDANDQTTVNLSGANSTPASALVAFKQTDVVFFWELEFTWTPGLNLSNANTVFTSPYYPYNILGEGKLQFQNMYPTWHPLSGIDAVIWQLIRPMRPRTNRTVMGGNPAAIWENPYTAQQNFDADNTELFVFQQALSPAIVAANTTAEQTFNITTPGVTFGVGDILVAVNKPTAQAGLAIGQGRISAANQVAITFINDTAAGITPTPTENYSFFVQRAGDMKADRTTITFTLEMPASVEFDLYYDLSIDGKIMSPPLRTIVSPLYMSGSAREITPVLTFNPELAANNDSGPYVINAGAPTVTTPSVLLGFTRVGIYNANAREVLPVVYNWQYVRDAKQVSLAGAPSKDYTIPIYGQILSIFVRMFDPAAASGGQPHNLATIVTRAQVQFGSNLIRFDDTPRKMQRRFLQQHGVLPPQGVLIWDLALDPYGRFTNATGLNTLTTAGVQLHLVFNAALSVSSYMVVGVEALVYVA